MDKELLEKTHCPFNGMKPCIGRDCVMYLETSAVKNGKTGEKIIEANIFEAVYPIPCAIIFSGLKSFYDMTGLKPTWK